MFWISNWFYLTKLSIRFKLNVITYNIYEHAGWNRWMQTWLPAYIVIIPRICVKKVNTKLLVKDFVILSQSRKQVTASNPRQENDIYIKTDMLSDTILTLSTLLSKQINVVKKHYHKANKCGYTSSNLLMRCLMSKHRKQKPNIASALKTS